MIIDTSINKSDLTENNISELKINRIIFEWSDELENFLFFTKKQEKIIILF